MFIFKSTLFIAFILLLFSGFNVTSAETDQLDSLPEDYSEYEQELQYLEKVRENDEEQESMAQANLISDSVSDKAAAPEKLPMAQDDKEVKNQEKSDVPTTNPGSPRRIRSR